MQKTRARKDIEGNIIVTDSSLEEGGQGLGERKRRSFKGINYSNKTIYQKSHTSVKSDLVFPVNLIAY